MKKNSFLYNCVESVRPDINYQTNLKKEKKTGLASIYDYVKLQESTMSKIGRW